MMRCSKLGAVAGNVLAQRGRLGAALGLVIASVLIVSHPVWANPVSSEQAADDARSNGAAHIDTARTEEAKPVVAPLSSPMLALPRRVGWGWDVEFGLGLWLDAITDENDDDNVDRLAGSIRIGALWVREPLVVAMGGGAEVGGLAGFGMTGQISLTHVHNGLWGQVGAGWIPEDNDAMASIAFGWSLLGVELQARNQGGEALFARLRIPIGTVWFLFQRTPTVISGQ